MTAKTKDFNGIDPSSKIYPNCKISQGVKIGEFSIIGKPSRLGGTSLRPNNKGKMTIISDSCNVGAHVIIGEGTIIGANTTIANCCEVEADVKIGSSCFIVHGARICEDSVIENDCIIGGFTAERSVIGSKSRVFGNLLHKQDDPSLEWDKNIEDAPILKSNVFVGMGSQVIGDVTLKKNVYIASGAIVTKDIPSNHVVIGINNAIPLSTWRGNLKKSLFFRG